MPHGAPPSQGSSSQAQLSAQDLMNQLPGAKRQEMMALTHRFRAGQLGVMEFQMQSKALLGERVFAQLTHGSGSHTAPPIQAGQPHRQSQLPRPVFPPTFRPPMIPISAMQTQSSTPALVRPDKAIMTKAENARSTMEATTGQDGNNSSSKASTANDDGLMLDVLHWGNINLQEEADMILREHDIHSQSTQLAVEDYRLQHDYFFNGSRLRGVMVGAARARGVAEVDERCFDLLASALQRRLCTMLESMSKISQHRVDSQRAHFKIKIENDPKKQIWLLERLLIDQEARFKAEETTIEGSNEGADGSASVGQAKKAVTGKGKGRPPTVEDSAIKTKLANKTAADALGLSRKSWMTEGNNASTASNPIQAHMDNDSLSQIDSDTNVNSPSGIGRVPTINFSTAPSITPTTDRELFTKFANRTISVRDLIMYCENDPHHCRSNLLISLYSQQERIQ